MPSKTPVKLIFVNRFFYPDLSATSQLLSDLVFGLADEETEVHVITSRSLYEDAGAKLPKSEKVNGVRVRRVWTSRFGRRRLFGRLFDYLSFYVTASLALSRLAAPDDTVIVKTDPPLFAIIARPILKLRRARLVNWLQDLFPEIAARHGLFSKSGMLARSICGLRDTTLCGSDLNVVICQGMRDHLLDHGVPANRVEVIPNWSDGEAVYSVPADENELRKTWGLEGTFVVGHSGNLGRVHDIETVKHAIEHIGRDANVAFLFIGGGVGYEAVRRWAERQELENVYFRPYQARDQLHQSLSVPDVHLISLAPEMEGLAFASKLYGILAAGRPAIFVGARDSEVAQILEDAGCGIGVEAGRGDRLAEAILSLKDNADVRHDMGTRARELFEREYDKPLAIERWRRTLLH